MQSKQGLIWPVLACMLLPLMAAWFAYPDTHLPPKFGIFPPEFVRAAPEFNPTVFGVFLLLCVAITALLLFPGVFGFKSVQPAPPVPSARFPVWFWIGIVLTLFFWCLMWARVTAFGTLVYYAFTPMWWGFILVLDGLVYKRSGGVSLLSSRPKTLLISALVSVAGWCLFEYLDYFVISNWYYPDGHMEALSRTVTVMLFLLAYTTVWPAIFEWYTLLLTFPALAVRYSNGPKLLLPGRLLQWGGLALIVLMVFFPYPLFWAMWLGPLAVLAGSLIRKEIWTPFTPLAQGNWSPMLLVAIASLFNGFFWEIWNYGSAHPDFPNPTNPNYWIYEIPYVNVVHIFSEMPILGYFGYLPFGILVWILYIWAGRVLDFDPGLGDETIRK